MDENTKKRVKDLLDICKKSQGEHLPLHHGSGSWATTYSNQFLDAAAELYVLFENNGSRWPILNLSNEFKDAGILSCRGARMSIDRVEYLHNTHLQDRISRIKSTNNSSNLTGANDAPSS